MLQHFVLLHHRALVALKLQTGNFIYSALYPQIPWGKTLTRRFWEALSHLTEALVYGKN